MTSKRIPGLIALLCLSALLSGCGDPARKEAGYLKQGKELFDKGEFEKARLDFKNAAAVKPQDPEPHYRLGLVNEALGNERDAIAEFVQASRQDAHYRPALYKLAQISIAAGQLDQGERLLQTAASDAPDEAEAHALRGALDLRRLKLTDADSEAEKALKLDPANARAFSVLAGVYVARRDFARAVDILGSALAKNPKDSSLLLLKAAASEQFKNADAVRQSYEALFALHPQEAPYRVGLAEADLRMGRVDDAEKALRDGIDAFPQNRDIKQLLVRFLTERRSPDVAEKQIRAFMAADPADDTYALWLADLDLRRGNADKAVAQYQKIITKDGSQPPGLSARVSLARIDLARSNRPLAVGLLNTVLGIAPGNVDALLIRAGLNLDDGQYDSAVNDLRAVLRQQPRNLEALRMLAETLVRERRIDQAVEVQRQVVADNPNDVPALVRLAQLFQLKGDSAEAKKILSRVTAAAPAYPVGWETAARVAMNLKDWQTAETAIKALAALPAQTQLADYLRGVLLEETGHPAEAIRQFMTVADANVGPPLLPTTLAALVETSRRQGALPATARYLSGLKPGNPYISLALAECEVELHDLQAATTIFDRLIDANVALAPLYLDRARLFLAQGKPEAAGEILKVGMDKVPADLSIPLMRADLMAAHGDPKGAIRLYQALLARDQALDEAANNLAELIADYQFGDPAALDKAQAAADRFRNSKDPSLLDTLGWVYYRRGDLDQAEKLLLTASESPQASPQMHYHLGAVLLKRGKPEPAKVQLQLAVKPPADYPGAADAAALLHSVQG